MYTSEEAQMRGFDYFAETCIRLSKALVESSDFLAQAWVALTFLNDLWSISVNLKRWLSYDYSAVAFLWSKYNTCARGKEGTYFQSVIITIGFLSHRSKSRDGIFLLFK